MIQDNEILTYTGLTYYDERIKDYIDNSISGSTLHVGDHITIDSNNRISAVYESSDFDISGLTDSQNLRETWSGKQDVLSAGTGIIIDANNVISVNEDEIAKIDDTVTETNKTWSSNKISGELEGKSNTGHTHEQYSLTGHTHDQYSLTSHTHSEYSLTGHTHNQYSLTSHTHSEYSLTSHTHTAAEVGALPSDTFIPSKTSEITNDSGFITGFTETDPTVPAWAKESTKPTYSVSEISGLSDELAGKSNTGHTHEQYSLTSHTHSEYSLTSHTHTAAEVGALPSSTTIPTTTSQLTNDSGFITGFTETDPTVHAWAKAENKPTYDVSEISGLTEELAGKSNTGHTHDQYSLTSHTHTAAEVGALPDDTVIPSKTSDLTNDSGFVIIDDSNASNSTTYSSSKIESLMSGSTGGSSIDDEHVSTGTTYSSNKITELIGGITSFDVQVVDELPVTGDTHTIYFTPSNHNSSAVTPEMDLLLYDNKDGVATVDFNKSQSTRIITSLTVGDVFKYVDDGSESQTPKYFNFSVKTEINDSGDTIYKVDDDLNDHILYNIGDTFRVTSVDPDSSVAFTTIGNNPSVEDGSHELKGITGHIALENNKIYRLTGYHQVTSYPSELEVYYSLDGLYFVTYEEVTESITPDYEVDNIGCMQMRIHIKHSIVPSVIDKENVMLSMKVTHGFEMTPDMFFSGIISSITLEDGHYYRFSESYILNSDHISGNYGVYATIANVGISVYTFEEVFEPEIVKYDGITYIPGGQLLDNYEYSKYPKLFCPVYKVEETDPQTQEITTVYRSDENNILYGDSFPQIKVGETVKITGENTGYENNPYVVIHSVDDTSLSINNFISGITSASVWSKDEYYRCTGYHNVAGEYADFIRLIATFEKVTNISEADYEFESLRCFCITRLSKNSVMNEWMWVDNDWELIGNTEVDLSNYYTKDETYSKSDVNSLLNGKSNTGHTHDQYSLTSHTHTTSQITGLDTALSGKSNTGHTHTISNISGLTEELNVLKSVFESSTYAFSSHINELTERADANDNIQNITVDDVINELNIIDNN